MITHAMQTDTTNAAEMRLRPSQVKAMRDLYDAIRRGARAPILQAMTGFGKTVVSCRFTRDVVRRGGKVLFLAHRVGLVRQKSEKLVVNGLPHTMWVEGERTVVPVLRADGVSDCNGAENIHVASVDTIDRVADLPVLGADGWVIIDECHRANASRVRAHYFASRILGLTATPMRDSGKPLGQEYDAVVQTAHPDELEAEGSLIRGRVESIDLFDDGGTVSLDMLNDFLSRDGIVSRYVENIAARPVVPTVIFCAGIDHARKVTEALCARGLRAVMQHSKQAWDVRDESMKAFLRGVEAFTAGVQDPTGADIIVNANILIEGWDVPNLRRVIILRHTDSEVVFLQQYGRGTRPFPGKQSWEFIDFAGNIIRHGDPFRRRVWSLDGAEMKRDRTEAAKVGVWRCMSCFGCFDPARVRGECPQCGAPVVGRARRLSTRAGEIVEWDEDQLRQAAELQAAEDAARAANHRHIKKLWAWARGNKGRALAKFKEFERSGKTWEQFERELVW